MGQCLPVALLAEGVDRNTGLPPIHQAAQKSPSSRRAWIEIGRAVTPRPHGHVALLAEGVDRNLRSSVIRGRAEGSPSSRRAWIEMSKYVKSQIPRPRQSPSSRRAWIEIFFSPAAAAPPARSPSSRRAWIEITTIYCYLGFFELVALLAEGVDRNIFICCFWPSVSLSPSSRRAWIEI